MTYMNNLESLEAAYKKENSKVVVRMLGSADDSKGWQGIGTHCTNIAPLYKLGTKMG